jgi:hypothetical protein
MRCGAGSDCATSDHGEQRLFRCAIGEKTVVERRSRVSWPKKASKVPTDITEDAIRTIGLPMGWVDVKMCAVDALWSGLKLMIRKELR